MKPPKAGIHTIQPAGQMKPAKAFNRGRKDQNVVCLFVMLNIKEIVPPRDLSCSPLS